MRMVQYKPQSLSIEMMQGQYSKSEQWLTKEGVNNLQVFCKIPTTPFAKASSF